MIPLLIFTAAAVALSLIADRRKTAAGLKTALRMFLNLLPPFVTVLIGVALILTLLPKEVISGLMGENAGALGYVIAALLGTVALIPGFVAYPLAAVLVSNGVTYPVIAVFITTLMMVGVVTLPLERKYFGWKVAAARNLFSFAGALLIGALMAVLWSII